MELQGGPGDAARRPDGAGFLFRVQHWHRRQAHRTNGRRRRGVRRDPGFEQESGRKGEANPETGTPVGPTRPTAEQKSRGRAMNIRAPKPLRRNHTPRRADPVCDPFYRPGCCGTIPVARIFTGISILLVLAWTNAFGQVATSLAPLAYQNQLYNPAPNPIPGLTGSPQPKGIAIVGGNVGAAGQAATPNDGTFYLVQSGFGQATAEPRHPDVLIGQEIVPDPALGADLTKNPAINP